MMTTSIPVPTKERFEEIWQALQAVEQLQADRLKWGLNHVDLYVENIDGDWLERWGEEDSLDSLEPFDLEQLREKLPQLTDS
jgi:hypothetical protein